jgi:drug/metabolite transporter (DMT)-like permease
VRLALLTIAALAGFASNSLLCRSALLDRSIDPVTFTSIRIISGAITLWLLTLFRRGESGSGRGSWASAFALFAYALTFSLAYVRLTAATGALILFAVVQLTMMISAFRAGERLRPLQWVGFFLALGGLLILCAPGVRAPAPDAAIFMTLAGVAWGLYTLRGRGSVRPLFDTSGNFLRAAPMALAVSLLAISSLHATPRGALLAAMSGAIASGVGYSFWYAVVPHIPAARAAVLQLTVPALAAIGGVALLGESVTSRLLLGAIATLGGVALSILGRRTVPVAERQNEGSRG